ncbi:MAG: lipoprotein LpqH [Cumulibacter sp.]
MKIKKVLATGIAIFALAGVAACSDDSAGGEDSKNNESTSNSGSDASADEGTDDAGPADGADSSDGADSGDGAGSGEVSTGGTTVVKVDGQDLESIDLDSVTCLKQGGKVNIASGSASAQQGLAVILSDEDPPKVEVFSIVVDDVALAVAEQAGAKIGSAEATVDGDEYTITGTAEGADLTDPTAGMISKDFEITVTCS